MLNEHAEERWEFDFSDHRYNMWKCNSTRLYREVFQKVIMPMFNYSWVGDRQQFQMPDDVTKEQIKIIADFCRKSIAEEKERKQRLLEAARA